jgi:hypothetical protein
MADNIQITQGSGTTIATDDVAGAHYQRFKLDVGTDGAASPVTGQVPISIGANKIASGAVASGAIASGAVASGAVASGAIASGAVASGAVASGAIAAGAFAVGALPAGAIALGGVAVPTAIVYGHTTVTTAGTRVPLGSSTTLYNGVTIKALHANTGWIYVGSVTVASGTGFVLDSGEEIFLKIANLATIYIDSSVNIEGVSYIGS